MSNVIDSIVSTIVNTNKFLVTFHNNPDGDAMGSGLAITLKLLQMGKKVTLYCQDQVPYNYRFLPGSERLETLLADGENFEASIVLDCNEVQRLGDDFPAEKARLGKLIVIDHHLDPTGMGDINYLDPKASSVGEMLFDVICKLPGEMDRDMAINLYCSILTDTGGFKYSNTSARAMKTAAELLMFDINPWEISSAVYENQPLNRLTLLAEVLGTLEMGCQNRCAVLFITREMFDKNRADASMIDGFVNYARSIQGVEVAALVYSLKDDSYKVSMRSRGVINVAAIAKQFGGGGHYNAGGFRLDIGLEDIKKVIFQETEKVLP